MSLEQNYQDHARALETISSPSIEGIVGWRCPSNIALVKYWGKYKGQIPANPSISFSLQQAITQTSVNFKCNNGNPDIHFYFEGMRNLSFEHKIQQFLKNIQSYFPFLSHTNLIISSHNTFPHSSGIASSASAMGALALCLCNIECQIKNAEHAFDESFYQKASFIARLGSGSAARSVYGGYNIWGRHKEVEGSSDEISRPLPFKIHDDFMQLKDAILLVDPGEKKVSSTQGHSFMEKHPYAKQRFEQARNNISELLMILQNGDRQSFFRLVEHEAMSLHAMMMTSTPGYILLKPNTLEILELITKYRESYGIPFCFTLDAGANVHILYNHANKEKIEEIINNEFKKYCNNEQIIFDTIGEGPQSLNNA
jgi:diphosphomevalonate decarboxylase